MTLTWINRAACRGTNPELFFAIGDVPEEARAICGGCPVRGDCLDAALANGERGVWGGLSEDERMPLRRNQRRRSSGAEAPEGSKRCTGCAEDKPLADYYPDGRATDGRASRCRSCHIDSVMARQRAQDLAPITAKQAARNRAALVNALQ